LQKNWKSKFIRVSRDLCTGLNDADLSEGSCAQFQILTFLAKKYLKSQNGKPGVFGLIRDGKIRYDDAEEKTDSACH
jgi:hypothetical protein